MPGISSSYAAKKSALAALATAAALSLAVLIGPIDASAANNIIPNPSVENGGNTPNNWNKDRWGTNSATFEYPVNGVAGQKAVQVKITNYTSGDAKWTTKNVDIEANSEYTFSNQYKSDTDTSIGVVYTLSGGNLQYDYIGPAPASDQWKKTSFTFKTPRNATKASFYHIINSKGTLTTDDYRVEKKAGIPPSNGNIRNASLEEAGSGGDPKYWYRNSWGDNQVSYSYPIDGKSGKGARVEITDYTSGDAKWAFEDVDVKSNTSYRFSDSYRASVATHLVARFATSGGVYDYKYLGTVSASDTWKNIDVKFTTLGNTKSVTVYHVINAKGYLETDEYGLEETDGGTTPPPGAIANPSLEESSNGGPSYWNTNLYGNLQAQFQYPVDGKDSARAAKVIVSQYNSGDAKWFFDEVAVSQNSTYVIEHDYNSDTATNITLRFTMNNGSYQYEGIETIPASSGWKKHNLQFTTPYNVKSFTLFHSVVANGSLTVDNYSLEKISAGNTFAEGMVSLTFDDGWSSQYDTALPMLNDAKVDAGFYIISQYTLNGYTAYVTPAQVKEMFEQGYEIGAHSQTHAHLTTLNDAQLNSEVAGSKVEIKNMGVDDPSIFIYPYGEKDERVVNAVKNAGYIAARGVGRGYNTPKTDKYDLKIQEVNAGTTLAQIKAWVDQAKADKTWLILMFHQVDNSNAAYGTTPQVLQGTLDYINQKNMKTVTVEEGVKLMQ